jgi:hypothetical protein
VLDDVEQYNATRLRLAAESAEMSGTVKELVVRAEDSRLLGDLSTMARTYARIMDTNRALLAEHQKRSLLSLHTSSFATSCQLTPFFWQIQQSRGAHGGTQTGSPSP